MKILNLTKYISYAFLGTLALITILLMLALSPLGVKLLVNIANDQEGITIENPSGSFYSEVSLGKLGFSNPQIKIAGDAVKLDIGLNCLFALEACIDNISARRLEVVLLENTTPTAPSEPLTDYIELPIAAYLHNLSIDQLTVFTQKIDQQKTLLTKLEKLNASVFMHKNLMVNKFSINDALVVLAAPLDASEKPDVPQNINTGEHWIALLKSAQYTPLVLPDVFIPINAEVKNIVVAKFCLQQGQAQEDTICTEQTSLNASIKKQKVNVNFATKPTDQIVSNISLQANIDFADAFSHDIKLRLLPNATLSSAQAQPIAVELLGKVTDTRLSVNSPRASNNVLSLSAKVDVTKPTLPVNLDLLANNYQAVLRAWLPEVDVPVSRLSASIVGNTEAYEINAKATIDSEQASDINIDAVVSLNDKYFTLRQLTTSGDIGQLNASIEAKLTQFSGTDGLALSSAVKFTKLQLQPLVPNINSNLNGNINVNASITPTQLWGELNCQKVQGLLQGFKLSLLCDVAINKAGVVNVKAFTLSQGKNVIKGGGRFELPSGLNTSDLALSENNARDDVNKLSNDGENSETNNSIAQWASDTKTALQFDLKLTDLASLYPGASGTILGKVNVKGKVDKPRLAANISITNLKFEQLRVQQMQIDALLDIANDWQTDITLASKEIWQEAMLAQQVNASIKGNLSSHKVSLSLSHPEYSFSHDISGAAIINANKWRWAGQWEQGVFESAFDKFTLEQATSIRINPTSASIRPHCWVSDQLTASLALPGPLAANSGAELPLILNSASGFSNNTNQVLCIEQLQYTSAETVVAAKLAYNLKVPLLHYFPDIVKAGTSLPFSTDVDLTYSPDKGIELDAYSLMTQANLTSSKHKIELVAVVANSSLKNQVLKTNVYAGTKSTGAIGLNSMLNLDPNNRTHKGQLRIDNFMLSPLQRFIPNVANLQGTLAGNILFDGLLIEPDLNGELNIRDVEVVADNYPYPVTNFNQTIIISNKKATIEGELELGAGTAEYSGVLTLFDEGKPFSFIGELDGAGMQLAFAKNEVLASPSLQFAIDPGNFSLKGDVTIPNAQIRIDELPQSAKSPSSDTIIIGKVPEPPVLPIGLDIDIRIIVDPSKLKRVTVNAFDLEASLGGDLQVQVRQKQNPETLEFTPLETYVYGEVNILSGSYEAYGQNLQIQKGAIFFSGAPSLPQFDVTAVRNPLNTANNVVAGIRLSGNPVVPKVELFSQPTMIQARQLSYLLRGTDLGGGANDSQDVMLVNMLVGFGVGNSENGVNRIGKSLGFDSLNVQTAGQGDSTQVQLTGRISDNIQVIYGVGLFDQATEVILRYQLLPKMYLEATGGATSAVDLFYEWSRGK